MTRRIVIIALLVLTATFAVRAALRERSSRVPELVWGKKGVLPGDFVRPRAATVGKDGRIYVVDFTARIQSYDANGKHTGITWQTPDLSMRRKSFKNSICRDGERADSGSSKK